MKRYRGLSLIELVIALGMSAVLLTAVASALHAASYSMRTNERFSKATQTARVAMLQMTTAIRQSLACQTGGTGPDPSGFWAPSPILKIVPGDPTKMPFAYRWDSDLKVLRHCTNPDVVADSDPVLARDVSAMTFTAESEKRLPPNAPAGATLDTDGVWVLVNLQVEMTVTVDGQAVRLSNSVVPRRTMTVR